MTNTGILLPVIEAAKAFVSMEQCLPVGIAAFLWLPITLSLAFAIWKLVTHIV